MNSRTMSFEAVRDNGSGMSKEPRNDRSRSRADKKLAFCVEATPNGRPLVDGRDEASRERYYRLFLKKGTLL